jgi:plastocyanin
LFALAVALAGLLFVAGLGFAASTTIVAQDNVYTPTTYSIDQGEVATFQDQGFGSHNVTANANGPDGKALFGSGTIPGGSSAGVNGTQFLSAGTYTFFCTIHPTTMQASLTVTGNGTPRARPSAALTLRTKKISKALKKGLLVAINASSGIDGVGLVAKLGKTTIGQTNGLSIAAGQQVEVVKLSKAGKSRLAAKSKATVKVTADIPFGSPASAKAKLK